MAVTYIVVALLASGVAVFALQNTAPVGVHFLAWTSPDTSVAVLTISAFAAGLIVTGVPLWLQTWRLRRQNRDLALRLRQSEVARADRERALLHRPPRRIDRLSDPPAA